MANSDADLDDLIKRMKEGDRAAREAVFERAFDQLERMARKRLDREFVRLRSRGIETGDVLDDAMIQVVKRLELGEELERLSSERDFFLMIASYVRRALLNAAVRLRGLGPSPLEEALLPGETAHSFSLEEMAAFHTAVANLPAELREAFELDYYGERTYEEAAELLGVHRDTIKRRLRAARDALKIVLQNG